MTNDVGTFSDDATTDQVELSGNVPADDTRSLVWVSIGELELVLKVALSDESGLAVKVEMTGKSGLLTIAGDLGHADNVELIGKSLLSFKVASDNVGLVAEEMIDTIGYRPHYRFND